MPVPRDPLFVAGIGASAGGLEALERLFKAMPLDTGIAFIIIQHLSPDFRSLMDELLARHTRMPIHRVEDGMTVEPNCIYLMPPKKEMIISGGRLLLTDKEPGQDLTLPIDHFFRSLAHDVGDRAIVVVLSGTGSDGSRGLRDVHEADGLVIAQSEETAKFDGMPRSAIDTGLVDCVLPPEEIPTALLDYVTQPRADVLHEGDNKPGSGEARGTEAIFKLLRDEYGIDFSYYKPNTVGRRIERRLSLNQSIDLDDYVERLRRDPSELNSLYRDLLIGVTRFFRDREAFERLERDVLPDLLGRKRPDEELRVWVAGCATGEEAYSLAILLHERLEILRRPINVKIFASDVHRASLEIAGEGVYDEEALAEVTPARLDRYFVRKADGYHVAPELRQMIVFARHNLIKDAPFTKLDLITCRNLLIYFQPAVQKKVLSLFHFGLKTGGVLFLGPSESPGELDAEFEPLDPHWKIYRKRRDIRLPADMRLPLSTPLAYGRPVAAAPTAGGLDAPLLAAYDRLLEDYMPPGLLVNEHRQLVHAFGGAGRFLRYRDGRPTADILDLLDGDLKLALAGALQRAIKDQAPVVYNSIRVRTAQGDEQIKLVVKPILNRRSQLTHLFITLESLDVPQLPRATQTEIDADEASREHLNSLETELRYTRENLQATIEELETSNEELQASNEELVASNEELQSTNEELHSVNEELYTVNAEYQKKIEELTELTDDMDNLLRSTDIGTIFLDRKLCIRKFTPQIGRAFDLLPQDVGRRIDSFSHSIRYDGLLADLQAVLQSGTPVEKEVQDRHGNWFFLRILPYRSRSKLDGVVLTLIDVSLLKRTTARLTEMSAIVESSDDAIIGMNLEGRITTWNRGAETLFGYTADEVAGRHVSMLEPENSADSTWTPQMLERLRSDQPGDQAREAVRRRKDGSLVDVLLSLSPIRDVGGALTGTSVIARDITQRKRAEEEIRRYARQLEAANQELRENVARRQQAEEEAREAVRRRDQFLAMLSHELRSPLTAVLNASLVLQRGEVDGAAPAIRNIIRRQSQQMARLLDDLLDVSRITRDKIDIRKQPLDLRATTRDAVEAVRPQFEAQNLQLDVNLPEQLLCVEGDPARLQQVQVNLLTNAAKYTPAGGHVWLSVAREGESAVIRVRDTGIGIPPGMEERIFDLFVQADGATGRADGGMGVGLMLVRSLVRLHGGEVTAHSDGPGRGSEFVVRLPISHAALQPEENESVPCAPERWRILLIEDHPAVREMTRLLLTSAGHEVQAAEDGPKGIEALQSWRPDVALIDIGLPGVDGYQVAQRIRALPHGESYRLVAVTGYGRPEDRERALRAGFNGHLVKPVDLKELDRLLHQLIPPRHPDNTETGR